MTTISATIIRDSISPTGKRLTTFQLRYPRFIHAELMTHRTLSRNASSSRAIPVERMIEDILADTAMPIHWGKNQPGMQAREEHNDLVSLPEFWNGYPFHEQQLTSGEAWNFTRDMAIVAARAFHKAGYHKQVINRILEPFLHINVVVTATEWTNFFALRDHPDAEPHIQLLAQKMKEAMAASSPVELQPGEWHLPYVSEVDFYAPMTSDIIDENALLDRAIKVSVARCARVSYLTHDGRASTVDEDVVLYDRLVGGVPLHASPTEHQATPDEAEVSRSMGWRYENDHLHGNFVGWIQYRKTLPNENIT